MSAAIATRAGIARRRLPFSPWHLVLIPAIKFFGENVTGLVPPGTLPIRDMSPNQIRGAYVLYIGAGRRLHLVAHDFELPGSPLEVPAEIIGHFDGLAGSRAVGWVADRTAPERPLLE